MVVTMIHSGISTEINLDGRTKGEIKEHLKELLKHYPELPKNGWLVKEEAM